MGDRYNQHKLPAFVGFVLSALAVCSWEHQAESVQPSSCSQELLRKTAWHFAPWSVLLSSTPVVCPSLPVQEIRFWDHQAEGEDCTSHTGKSFSMTFIGLQFTSMSSNPNYQKLLIAKQLQYSFLILNMKNLPSSPSKHLELKDFPISAGYI